MTMRSNPLARGRGFLGATALAATLLASGVCRADEPPAPAPKAADAAPVSDEVMAEARKQFQAGVSLLDDPDGARYEDAYHAFKKAYELSRSPKVLGNIGFCALKLERDGEAIDAYASYLREVKDIDERERTQIERDLATLTSTVARMKVTMKKPGSWVLVDTRVQTRGAPVVNSYSFEGTETTVRLRPGRHSFKVKGEEGESLAYETTIDPASQSAHEFTIAPPAAPMVIREEVRSKPSYVGPIVLGSLGVVAVGAGVVTGLMAKNKTSDIEQRCPADLCPADYDFRSDRTDAKTLGTIADVAFIGGGVAIGGAVLWALFTPRGSSPRSTQTGSAAMAWQPSASCAAHGCNVRLGGTF